MSDPWRGSWSNNPNAPNIPSWLYRNEKAYLSQGFIQAISYGIIIVLFFNCMGALLDPVKTMNRSVKWGLIAHTATMFSLLTVPTALFLATLSNEYIDNREFSGDDILPPGPFGIPWPNTFTVVFYLGFPLSQWLADGLLLYRCHVLYFMNFRVTALPCLMYLTTIGLGIASIYEIIAQLSTFFSTPLREDIYTSYNSTCLALNLVLTTMIVVRLAISYMAMQKAMVPVDGFYRMIVTILIESFSLYAIFLLLYIATWASRSIAYFPIGAAVGAAQAAAPFLIILRVANQRATTAEGLSSGNIDSIRFRSYQESLSGEETVLDDVHTERMDTDAKVLSSYTVGMEDRQLIEEVPW